MWTQGSSVWPQASLPVWGLVFLVLPHLQRPDKGLVIYYLKKIHVQLRATILRHWLFSLGNKCLMVEFLVLHWIPTQKDKKTPWCGGSTVACSCRSSQSRSLLSVWRA